MFLTGFMAESVFTNVNKFGKSFILNAYASVVQIWVSCLNLLMNYFFEAEPFGRIRRGSCEPNIFCHSADFARNFDRDPRCLGVP